MNTPSVLAVKLDLTPEALQLVDDLVERGSYASRDDAVEAALNELLRDRFPSLEPQHGGC